MADECPLSNLPLCSTQRCSSPVAACSCLAGQHPGRTAALGEFETIFLHLCASAGVLTGVPAITAATCYWCAPWINSCVCTLGLSQTSFSLTLSGLVLRRPRKPGHKVRQRQKLPSHRLRFSVKHFCGVLPCALCNSRTDTNYTRTSHAAGVPSGERTTDVWPGVLPCTHKSFGLHECLVARSCSNSRPYAAQAPSAPSAPPVPGFEDPVKPSSSQRQASACSKVYLEGPALQRAGLPCGTLLRLLRGCLP